MRPKIDLANNIYTQSFKMWKLLPCKKPPFSLKPVQVFSIGLCHCLQKCNAFASSLHYLLLSCRLDCHTKHDLCHWILSASARLYFQVVPLDFRKRNVSASLLHLLHSIGGCCLLSMMQKNVSPSVEAPGPVTLPHPQQTDSSLLSKPFEPCHRNIL